MTTQTIFKTAGSTSQSTELFLVQKAAATSPGDPITGLAYNTSSLTAYYKINGTGTLTSITLATQTDTGAYSSGGFVETSSTNAPGCYRFDIPNACIATAGEVTIVFNGAANMATHSLKIICTAVDLYDAVHFGLTGIPNAAAGASGGLLISGSNSGTTTLGALTVTGATTWTGGFSFPAGNVPYLGVIDSGTAQAATSTTLQLRSAAAFADSELNGATIVIKSATAGAGQRRIITAYTGSTDTATVDTWTTTPTGTIMYEIYGTAPGSSASPLAANVTQWNSTNVATPDTAGYPKVTIKDGTGTGEIDTNAGAIVSVTTVGSVTGAVGSVTGAVGSVTGNVGGNVVGTVAGVTPASATSINATRYQKNTGSQKVFFTLVDSTDHVTRKTGITVTATRSLDGAAFGAATGTVTEIGNGVYYLTPSAGDINADDVVYRFSGTACDPVELHVVTY